MDRHDFIEILDTDEELRNLTPQNGINVTSIHCVYGEREKLVTIVGPNGDRFRRVSRELAASLLDRRLSSWLEEQRKKGEQVANEEIMNKAMEINEMIGGPKDFKATVSWLYGFKYHEILLREQNREQKWEDNAFDKVFRYLDICVPAPIQYTGYENIYNMTTTILLWKAYPSTSDPGSVLRLYEDALLKKNSVTVGLCTNILGNHKLDPLFLCKKDVTEMSKKGTPVVYETGPRSWLDRELFTTWYNNCFKPAVLEHQLRNGKSGKIILLVDSRQGSVIPEEMRSEDDFEILCLPKTLNSLPRPMEEDIVEKTKTIFRRKMLEKVIQVDDHHVPKLTTVFDICNCITTMADAWAQISQSDIVNCWKKVFTTLPEMTATNLEPAEPQRCHTRDLIDELHRKNVFTEDEEEFLCRCLKLESEMFHGDQYNMDSTDSHLSTLTFSSPSLTSDSDFDAPPNEMQMDNALSILTSWSKHQPNYIQFLVESIRSYCKDKRKDAAA